MLLVQLLIAFALGALLMYGYTRVRGGENADIKALKGRLEAKTHELEAYKNDVQEHFLGTAEAMDTLTRSYRSVFEGLERDANRLVGEKRFQGALKTRATSSRNVVIIVNDGVSERFDPASQPASRLSPSRSV